MIEVKNLTKKYKYTIFENLNFHLKKNNIYIITGASGSGKTTLLNILSTLDRDYEGSVLINAKMYKKDKEASEFRRKNIGFIFQSFELLSDFTLRENCLVSIEINNLKIKNIDELIEKFFDENKYHKIKNNFPNQLSGGEQQRTAIARALIPNPSIIIADEPTGNLDKYNSDKVIDMLLEYMQNKNKLLIVVTHDKDMATNIAQKLNKPINKMKINKNIQIEEISL